MITKDMTIANIIKEHPHAAEIMMGYGLQCVGCHVNEMESLEDGAKGHGMPDEIFDKMLGELNDSAKKEEEAKELAKQDNIEGPIVKLTEKAANKAKDLIKQEGKEGHGLRIGVIPGGCSGFNYELEFEVQEKPGDYVYEQNGLKIFIQKDHFQYLKDMELDYVDSLNQQGFKFNNPNAAATCGCGTSFSA